MYTHVCKCKLSQVSGEGDEREAVEGVNSNMICLIHYKNLCKCYSVPSPSTTIIMKKEKVIKPASVFSIAKESNYI
jgi:hypothetical protein